MRFHGVLTCLLSLITAIHGIVIFNIGFTTPLTDLLSAASHWSLDADHKGVGPPPPPVQPQVSPRVFRNQNQATENAKKKNGYYFADWEKHTLEWIKLDGAGPLPTQDLIVADHKFDLQMLTLWMNKRGVNEAYFGQQRMDKLKKILNGEQNTVYVTSDLNCQKSSIIKKMMTEVLDRGRCTPQSAGPLVEYIKPLKEDMELIRGSVYDLIWEVNQSHAMAFKAVTDYVLNCLAK